MNGALPDSSRVDIGVLARILEDRTTSYKFFFFLALLDRVERAGAGGADSLDRPILLDGLAVDMVLGAWYPHGFCRLSLGAVDQLQQAVDAIDWGPIRGSWIVAGGQEWKRLRGLCARQADAGALLRFVPYRLIRPFFAAETRGLPDHLVNARIAALADTLFTARKPLYCFTGDRGGIILQHDWLEYLERNIAIVRGWARLQLAEYLQARNPNIPGLIDKLSPPPVRASLAAQTSWWRAALPLIGARAICIYSGAPLVRDDFSLDHYLPWSFVAHDRAWNLVPIPKSINSAKSDRIPSVRHLGALSSLQHAGIAVLRKAWPEGKWIKAVDPFMVDLRLGKDALLDLGKLRGAYEAMMPPLEAIAERQGFEGGWEYSAGVSEAASNRRNGA